MKKRVRWCLVSIEEMENTFGPYNIAPIPPWWTTEQMVHYLNEELALYNDHWFDDRGMEFADLLSIRSACFRGKFVPVGAWAAAVKNYEVANFGF